MKKEKFFLREKISSDFQGKCLGLNAKEEDKAKCYLNKDGKIQFEPCKKKGQTFSKNSAPNKLPTQLKEQRLHPKNSITYHERLQCYNTKIQYSTILL